MDMEFGKNGALYVLDYGTGWFNGDGNSALYRIEYAADGHAPKAVITPSRTSGPAPLTVAFSSAGTVDPDGDPITLAWDFDGNGTTDSTAANPSVHVHGQRHLQRHADGPGLHEQGLQREHGDHGRQHRADGAW